MNFTYNALYEMLCGSTLPPVRWSQYKKLGEALVVNKDTFVAMPNCEVNSFMLNYRYRACMPKIKQQAVEMAVHSSGIRDCA